MNPSVLPSARSVRLALFGVGRWGAHWLRNLQEHPQAKLLAVVDPCQDRLHTLARQHQLNSEILLADWQQALQTPGLEAVVLATPAVTHYPMIRAALEQGLHVLCEKPLTLSPTEALELCELAERQQRQLVVDHTYLFHPAVQQGQRLIGEGELGELRYGYASRTHLGPVRQDVDALWDLAIHDIAIFNHWLAALPVQVQAQGAGWLQPQSGAGLADLVWVKLTYASGFEAMIHLCWSNPDKQRRLTVTGSEGSLVFNEMAVAPLMLYRGALEAEQGQFLPVRQQHQAIELAPVEPLQAVCEHFLGCVQQNHSSHSDGRLGAKLVEILAALTQSLQQGGCPVRL
ncbi:MAG: Gfo/Idh/MocA family oxidoreductase [Pegethrix bostrychoides GSE-TBD4-15B]|jgi:predicted dehydrogenase|uniref:Gfo/Idh/MocA family oxidoreductase n=1 Tax=Pegethrix bostrychoides GSE-TBD4-15B TaxID=2839662 RepID=A0A951PBQ3_9CYAN|nr:Gfo/Idh/MocA family oxidoreductase [Pegethrix bostrychoides GSE-TBD4-15B]